MRALAVDIGGSHAGCGVVAGRRVEARRRIEVQQRDLAELLPVLAAALGEMQAETGRADGVALAFCGLVDSGARRIITSNDKYPDACSIDLNAWCRENFDLPLYVENDARMALLGERYAGAARNFDDVVMMTLGTGIGGAAMIGGRLLRGKHHQAGCLGGHFGVPLSSRLCTCGNLGCAEAEASTWSLPGVCAAWPGYAESELAGSPDPGFAALFAAADHGDRVGIEVLSRCLEVWAAAAVNLIHAYDPDIVVLGGGAMQRREIILPYIEDYVHRHAWTPWGKVRISGAELGNDAALFGAIPALAERA